MQKMSRRLDWHSQLERLERRHWTLKEQVAVLDGQRFLTVSEQLALHDLKKQKLATKDLLIEVRNQLYDAE